MKNLVFCTLLFSFLIAADSNTTGEQLYTKNGCYGCHGSNAQGGNGFPKLAGKPEDFLQKRLFGYKNGTIHSNRANMMQPFAKRLSNEEIKKIAHFLSSLSQKKLFDEERYFEDYVVGDSSGS